MIPKFMALLLVLVLWLGLDAVGLTYTTSLVSRKSNTSLLGVAGTAAIMIANIFVAYYWIRAMVRLFFPSVKDHE